MKFTFALIILCCTFVASAQEVSGEVYYAKRYLDINIHSQEKFNKRVAKQQDMLLVKLKRKERRYAARLKRKDSTSYARYEQQPLTFDSISKVSKNDNAPSNTPTANFHNGVDSLKQIEQYLQDKMHLQGDNKSATGDYGRKLSTVSAQGNKNAHINNLINQRMSGLKQLNAGSKLKGQGLGAIEKDVFYAKCKIKAFKGIMDEPSKAEEKAMEYLQGQPGFDKYLQGNDGMQGLQGKNMSSADLGKMGFQTKQQITANLQKKFGGNLSGLQQNMGTQVKQFQDDLNKVKSTKNTVKQSRQSIKHATNLNKPSFKVNPMRGLPFSKRIERQYNYQTTRATIDGKPAMLQLSAMAGFKHTPRLTYGLGVAASVGLGQNWNNIRMSFEGAGLRSFATWRWQYGISAYIGYERLYRLAVFASRDNAELPVNELNPHNTQTFADAALIGIEKNYRINDKWSGGVQLLYDVWWKEKGLRSPVELRFTTLKK